MELYGFAPNTLFGLLNTSGMLPIDTSSVVMKNGFPIYNYQNFATANFVYTFNGSQMSNTNANGLGYFGTDTIASPQYTCDSRNQGNAFNSNFPDWLSTINGQIDLRGFLVTCQKNSAKEWYYNRVVPDQDVLYTDSSYFGGVSPVAFTTESLFYAQSGYFVTVVMVQWSNVFACKSRKVIYSFILGFSYLFWC